MKRPNIKRMQKHAARSASDRTRRTFELTPDVSDVARLPGFNEWLEHFEKKMRAKHGHEPKIDISYFQNSPYSTLGRDVTVALKYVGERTNPYVEMVNVGNVTVEEANRRMRGILWDGL